MGFAHHEVPAAGEQYRIHPDFVSALHYKNVAHHQLLFANFLQKPISLHLDDLVLILPLVLVDVEVLDVDHGLEEDHQQQQQGRYDLIIKVQGVGAFSQWFEPQELVAHHEHLDAEPQGEQIEQQVYHEVPFL